MLKKKLPIPGMLILGNEHAKGELFYSIEHSFSPFLRLRLLSTCANRLVAELATELILIP